MRQLDTELVVVARDVVGVLQDLDLDSQCFGSYLDQENSWEVVVEGHIHLVLVQADSRGTHLEELDLEAERQVEGALPMDVVVEVVVALEEVRVLDRLDLDLP